MTDIRNSINQFVTKWKSNVEKGRAASVPMADPALSRSLWRSAKVK